MVYANADFTDHIDRDPADRTHIGLTVTGVLGSGLWRRREQARAAYLHAYTALLWHRAIWRSQMNQETRAAYRKADQEHTQALHRHIDVDGFVFSKLASGGFDPDQLPADRDECPLCRGQIIDDHGCTCTNVDLALELG